MHKPCPQFLCHLHSFLMCHQLANFVCPPDRYITNSSLCLLTVTFTTAVFRTEAAYGCLKPAPTSRLRRAFLHHRHNTVFHRNTFLAQQTEKSGHRPTFSSSEGPNMGWQINCTRASRPTRCGFPGPANPANLKGRWSVRNRDEKGKIRLHCELKLPFLHCRIAVINEKSISLYQRVATARYLRNCSKFGSASNLATLDF